MGIFRNITLLVGMLLSLSGQLSAQGYAVSPTVPDFMDLTADCVVATYGTTENPFANTGLQPERHKLITALRADLYTNGGLSMLPPEESKAVRLGNSDRNGEAESISYHFKVDPERSVLLVKFALVLEDPGHLPGAQPRFVVRILDEYGTLVESCAEYEVSARAGIEGFHTSKGHYPPILWRGWNSAGLDLSRYVNRAVQVQFVMYDCADSEHFGYAYFTASCIPNKLSVTACTGGSLFLSAPEGFASYLWNDGAIGNSRRVLTGGWEQSFFCELTSVTGCMLSLGAVLSPNPPPGSLVLYDTIYQGEPYQNTYYSLPAQNRAGTIPHTTTWVDPVQCKGGVTVTTFLTVRQRFYPVAERICYGEDFQKYGFDIRQPPVGIYRDSLYFSAITGGDSIVALTLQVDNSFSPLSAILGELFPCGGSVEFYTVPDVDESVVYYWQFPEGYFVTDFSRNGVVEVVVTNEAKGGDLILTGVNGCGSGSVSLPLTPHPVYSLFFTDTVCAGTEYRAHGFSLPAVDSAGYYRYTRLGRTVFGCDSNVVLELYVYEAPSVRIAMSDSVLCSGDEVTLQAVTGKVDTTVRPPATAIGDIYCTDKSVVKPEEFLSSGKTAMGVVFWVHPNGKNGWIVALKDGGNVRWGRTPSDFSIPGLTVYSQYDKEAFRDTNGYTNTAIIRNAGDSATYPAVYNVDFENGWYLPAILQIRQLHSHAHLLKASLEAVNGEAIARDNYWSSSIIRLEFSNGSEEYPCLHSFLFGPIYSLVISLRPHRIRPIFSF